MAYQRNISSFFFSSDFKAPDFSIGVCFSSYSRRLFFFLSRSNSLNQLLKLQAQVKIIDLASTIFVLCFLCEYWAKKRYQLNADGASSETNNNLRPIHGIINFFLIMQSLFQIAKDFLEQSIKRKTELLDTITSVCNIGIQH